MRETNPTTPNNPVDLVRAAQLFTAGEISLADLTAAVDRANCGSYPDVTLDLDRARRCGFPEVVYAAGKSPVTLLEIAERMDRDGIPLLMTRLDSTQAIALAQKYPDGVHHPIARTFRRGICRSPTGQESRMKHGAPQKSADRVAVIAAGTTDLPVADEAVETLAWMGVPNDRIADVGVAGPQRLRMHLPRLQQCSALVVVAGMEGALPSAVAGHVSCPVFAVPTSVGYGTHFGGLAALLSMLNSCVPNVAVVNIDAGFRAAYLAGLVAWR